MASGGLSDNEVELRKDRPLTEGGEIMLENKIKTYTNSLKEIQQEIDDIIKDEETNPLVYIKSLIELYVNYKPKVYQLKYEIGLI